MNEIEKKEPVNHEDINLEEDKNPLQWDQDGENSLMAAMQMLNSKQVTGEADEEDKPKVDNGYTNYEELD